MRCQSFFRLVVASGVLFAAEAFLYAQCRIATQTHVRSQDLDASRLDQLIAQNRYLELQRELPAAELSSSDRTYFEGVVADRTHNVADAIALLGKAVPDLKAHSEELIFSFDSGAGTGTLTSRYFQAFPAQFASLKPNRISAGGAGGTRFMQGYALTFLRIAPWHSNGHIARSRGAHPAPGCRRA